MKVSNRYKRCESHIEDDFFILSFFDICEHEILQLQDSMKNNYVFLIKEKTITPQSLEEDCCGDVLRETIRQGFYLSRIHVFAANNKEALEKFLILTEVYPEELATRTIIC